MNWIFPNNSVICYSAVLSIEHKDVSFQKTPRFKLNWIRTANSRSRFWLIENRNYWHISAGPKKHSGRTGNRNCFSIPSVDMARIGSKFKRMEYSPDSVLHANEGGFVTNSENVRTKDTWGTFVLKTERGFIKKN